MQADKGDVHPPHWRFRDSRSSNQYMNGKNAGISDMNCFSTIKLFTIQF